MDENGGNGLHFSGIIVALLLFGAWAFEHEQLTSTRPELHAPLQPNTTSQDIPARLWEDPIDAVARYRNRLDSPQEKHILGIEKVNYDKQHTGTRIKELLEWLRDRKGLKDLIIMPVMLPGHGYAEDREDRLRRRQAVLAGLGRWELSPLDGNHLGYWAREQKWSGRQTPFAIPYEVFLGKLQGAPLKFDESNHASKEQPAQGVLVLWLDSSQFDKNPMVRLGTIIQHFIPHEVRSKDNKKGTAKILVPNGVTTHVRIIGPVGSGDLALMVKQVIKTQDIDDPNRQEEIGNHRWIFNLLKEYNRVVMISPTASAPAASLFSEIEEISGNGKQQTEDREEAKLVDFFRNRLGITFIRTTTTDDRLVKRLVDELGLRNILPHCTPQTKKSTDFLSRCLSESRKPPYFGHRHHVVIISEWDTLYGRTLPSLFNEEVRRRLCENEPLGTKKFLTHCEGAGKNSLPLPWVHRYGYLRGIDGSIPQIGEHAKRGDQPGSINSIKVLDQTEFLEPTVGRSQYDYLRRLALQIAEKDRELRRSGEGSIRAFGILGNDFFDKLLILQALRDYFPDHIFFTTDLDAGYLDPDHYPWTRNLVVASSFGLTLHEEWNKMVPPARSGNQTSMFLAAMLAHYPEIEDPTKWKDLSSLLQARIFEVGRDRFFDLKPALDGPREHPEHKPEHSVTPELDELKPPLVDKSISLYPAYFTVQLPERTWTHGVLLVLTALFLLAAAPPLRRFLASVVSVGNLLLHRWPKVSTPLVLVFMILVVSGIAIGAMALIEMMLASEEPFASTSGVSGWPSEIILLLAGGVAWVLVLTSYRAVVRSDKHIYTYFFTPASCPVSSSSNVSEDAANRPKAGVKTGNGATSGFRSWLMALWRWYFPGDSSKPHTYMEGEEGATLNLSNDRQHELELAEYYDAASIWQNYRVNAQGSHRVGRLMLMVVPFYAAVWMVLICIAEPISPLRGETALWVSFWIGMVWLGLPFLILLFGVFDEMLVCNVLVRQLAQPKVGWRDVRDVYTARMPNMSVHMVYQWISIRFIAERTKASSRLVYAPFIILLFIMLSLSSRFDNWDTSGSVTGIIFLCGFIAFLSAVLVRRAAHVAKKQVLDELHNVASRGEYEKSKTEEEGARVLIDEIMQFQEGAFRKWYNEPAVRAMAWVLTIAGFIMTEHFTFGG